MTPRHFAQNFLPAVVANFFAAAAVAPFPFRPFRPLRLPVVAPVVAPVVVQSKTHAPGPCEVLVLNPTGDNTSTVLDDIKKSVTKKLKNVQMTFITTNDNSKKISLGFPSSQSRDDGAAVINENDFLSSIGYESKNASKLLPKVLQQTETMRK